MEWKAEVSRKLEDLSELRELRKDVQRIAAALEKLTSIEGQDSDKEQISWPESEENKTEVQGSTKKRKQREQRSDGAEEERQVEEQEDENCKGTPPFLSLNGMTILWSYLSLFN